MWEKIVINQSCNVLGLSVIDALYRVFSAKLINQ